MNKSRVKQKHRTNSLAIVNAAINNIVKENRKRIDSLIEGSGYHFESWDNLTASRIHRDSGMILHQNMQQGEVECILNSIGKHLTNA